MFPILEKALKNLGVTNCAIYGKPSSETEFYEMVKPVVGIDQHGTNVFAETPQQYSITYAEFAIEVSRVQAEHDAAEYQRQRATEYPPIGDQLDALWKGGDAAAEMLARVQAVKSKYPKQEK
jgi:hypothetical protein